MNWNAQEMDVYIQQKEYIDTLVVPFVSVQVEPDQMKASASASDFLMYLSRFIEAQFKGRMVFTPPMTFTKSVDLPTFARQVAEDFKESAFKHTFFLTTDASLAHLEIDGVTVVWLPSIPIESMEPNLKQSIMEDQLRQVLPVFTEKWSSAN